MDLFKDKLIKILFFIFRNFYSDFIFIKLLNYFYNNRLPQIIIIICEPILFKKNISQSVYDIYFQSLRSLNCFRYFLRYLSFSGEFLIKFSTI